MQPVRLLMPAALALALPTLAHAHAILLASTPRLNGTVHGSALRVDLRFNSRVDGARCTLSIAAPDGRIRALAIDAQSSPNELTAQLAGLHTGAYTLRWQALAGDGHITRGQVPFQVE